MKISELTGFIPKGNITDLSKLAEELETEVAEEKVIEFYLTCMNFNIEFKQTKKFALFKKDSEFVKGVLAIVIDGRKENEERDVWELKRLL